MKRLFHNFISNVDPETLASLNSENSGTVFPEMFNIASNMISNMSPEELQKILQVASSFQGSNPYFLEGDSEMRMKNSNSGPLPPDVPKTSADMTSKMSPYELQKIFQLASSLKERDSVITAMTMTNKRPISDKTLKVSVPSGVSSVNKNHDVGESRSCRLLSDFEMDPFPPNFPPSTCDMQDQMRNQLKDPAMQQMFTSIIKNMSPEMMSTMSEQFGMKLSREDPEKAQQVMSSLSPEDLDRMVPS
ncbi:PREDICTED: outer envelope protein 61-like [Nelumbo nucifera]|uniref:Outer envelope protein 61-like n=1 Tax=Nelumbo nucifera TaxID=4432 RepID=A0A1U8Q5W5_NELNU|nr:PREDICTED: outer envelope protein 61-like [Nelumbo nucifera]